MKPWLEHLEKRLPEERFAKFLESLVTSCRRKGELHWWMEREWEKLVADHPEYANIDPVLTEPICHIHRVPLHQETQEIIYGYFNPSFTSSVAADCPFGMTFLIGPDWGGEETETTALVCKKCRDVYTKRYSDTI